jgi:hypothetical protein
MQKQNPRERGFKMVVDSGFKRWNEFFFELQVLQRILSE